MSELAERERVRKQGWAAPGGAHDRVVRLLKLALPVLIGVLMAYLALAPLSSGREISFILDKNKVENAPERMRVDLARYVGEDKEGRPFTIVARSAVQRSSDLPIVDISGMMARLMLPQGPAIIAANLAHYNLDEQMVRVVGPVRVIGPEGYRLDTSNVTIDLRQRTVEGSGRVQGSMRLGQFTAGRLRADLGTRTVTLDQGARLKIVQGAVR